MAQDSEIVKDESSDEDFMPIKRKNYKKVVFSESSEIEELVPTKRKYKKRAANNEKSSDNEEFVPVKR